MAHAVLQAAKMHMKIKESTDDFCFVKESIAFVFHFGVRDFYYSYRNNDRNDIKNEEKNCSNFFFIHSCLIVKICGRNNHKT